MGGKRTRYPDKRKPLKPLQHKNFSGFYSGTPEGTRTPNIQNRNLTLYPLNYGRTLTLIA